MQLTISYKSLMDTILLLRKIRQCCYSSKFSIFSNTIYKPQVLTSSTTFPKELCYM